MENREVNNSLIAKAIRETQKPGFLKALMVFFCCVIGGIVVGMVYDILQLAVILGIGLGLIWMGVAYFNQKEQD